MAKKKPNPFLGLAGQMADASLAPELSAARQGREQDRIAANNKAFMLNSVGAALSRMAADDPSRIQGYYGNAANQQGAFSSGYSDALKQRGAGAQSAVDQNVNTLTGGSGGVGPAPTGADPSLFLGNLDANSLAAQGASWASAAEGRDQAYTGQYGNQALGALNEWDAQRKQDQSQIDSILARRPGLLQDALTNLYQIQNSANANRIQQGYLQLQNAKTVQDQANALTNLTGTIHIVKNGQVVDTGQVAPGSDAFGQVTTAHTATAKAAASAAGKSKAAHQKAVTNMNNDLASARHDGAQYALQLRGNPVKNPNPSKFLKGKSGAYLVAPGQASELGPGATTTNDPAKARRDSAYDYNGAYTQVWNFVNGDGLIARYNLPKSKVDELVRTLLIGAGWVAPPKPTKTPPAPSHGSHGSPP